MPATKKRTRRSPDQMIQDLQQEIERLKNKAAQAKVKKDPALKHINGAVKAIDKAVAETGDTATRKALGEARATLVACLSLSGVLVPKAGRAPRAAQGGAAPEPEKVLSYISKHPGSSGAEVAEALGTDTAGLRPVMRDLIDDGRVKTKGKARGMRYTAA